MKLLLHACCGPCSLEPVRILAEAGHDITIAYLNSNIAPASEYEHRIKTLLEWAKSQNIPVIEGPYEPATWQNAIKQTWDGTQENRADAPATVFGWKSLRATHMSMDSKVLAPPSP